MPLQEGLRQLQEIFGDVYTDQVLQNSLQKADGDVDSAVDKLLQGTGEHSGYGFSASQCSSKYSLPGPSSLTSNHNLPGPSSVSSQRATDVRNCSPAPIPPSRSLPTKAVTLGSLLQQLASVEVNTDQICDLEVSRDKLWRQAASFYKNSAHARERLHKSLSIEFTGEDGVDGGALKNDFFELLMAEINERLFEGTSTRRLLKKDWGLEGLFTLAGGTMVAHSLIQGGPGLPILCPSIYHFMVSLDRESAIHHLPLAADIPRNLATTACGK